MRMPAVKINHQALEELYNRYNRREYVSPDPIQFLYEYEDPEDREIVALVAASLSFGKVAHILKSVANVLERMDRPAEFLRRTRPGRLIRTFADFRHRYAGGAEMAAMLIGARAAIRRYGSLQKCFEAGLCEDEETVLPALGRFVGELSAGCDGKKNYLLPSPERGSACKRWNMLLRWMVRRDVIDPGGWDRIPASKLVVPLDTHMHRIGRALKLTRRKAADLRTAMEITKAFRRVSPDDPVKYDFALSRLGIRRDADMERFLRDYAAQCAA